MTGTTAPSLRLATVASFRSSPSPEQTPTSLYSPHEQPPLRGRRPLLPRRRPAQGHRRADRGARARRQVPDPPRRHRLGQDDDAGAYASPSYGKPTLVLSHNKTLAAQLYGELRQFLPKNAVEYFVSYYDYYQPEAYVPSTDVYIEKDASINQDIESLRLRATSSLMEREDVVIVATVSAIYGLGDPVEYRKLMVTVQPRRAARARRRSSASWCASSTPGTTSSFEQGTFRVRGDSIEIFPAYAEQAIRIELWGDEVERISKINPLTGETIAQLEQCAIYPAKHFVTERSNDRARGHGHSRRARRAADRAQGRGEAARGAAARVAHQLRHRDAARGGHLRRHRELLAPPERAPCRASAPRACSTTSRPISWSWWTSRT